MKKSLGILLVIGFMICTGCRPGTAEVIKDIGGISMVPVKEASGLLGLNYADEKGHIVLRQDNIALKIHYTSPNVYKDGHIMYIMESPAIKDQGTTYVPLSFFTDYLEIAVRSDDKNQLSITDNSDFSLCNVVQFLPQEVRGALNDENYPHRDEILKAVELPRSMNIDIPKINMKKVIQTKPLDAYAYDFKGELKRHGYKDEEIPGFSYHDYKVIERSWKLPEEMTKSLKKSYPELADKDLSQWTYGDYEKYYTEQDQDNFARSFTKDQTIQLNQRGILLEDIFYLRKEFHQIDTILAKPDEVLKKTIEGYYQISIDALQ